MCTYFVLTVVSTSLKMMSSLILLRFKRTRHVPDGQSEMNRASLLFTNKSYTGISMVKLKFK